MNHNHQENQSTAAPKIRRSNFWRAASVGSFILACLLGAAGGIGSYTFYYAQGASYLSNDAQSCANCHVMQSHYDAWLKSSHRNVARCNDCHAPHDFVGKWYCKGRNGFFHSLAFTTGHFPDEIRIHEYNSGVAEHACRDCHAAIVDQIDTPSHHADAKPMSCIRCHRDVGHLH